MRATLFTTLISAGLAAAAASAASGAELQPIEAQHVSLGAYSGIVYYTTAGSTDQLVATLGAGDAFPSVRFVTDLLVGQSTTLSVPREVGIPAIRIRFERRGDRIFVTEAPAS